MQREELGRGVDLAARGGFDVDVVDPHARAADHFQLVGARDQVSGQLRGRADDDSFVLPDRRLEVRLGVDVDVEALAQQLDARLGDLLANEQSQARAHTCTGWSYA